MMSTANSLLASANLESVMKSLVWFRLLSALNQVKFLRNAAHDGKLVKTSKILKQFQSSTAKRVKFIILLIRLYYFYKYINQFFV